MTETFEHCQTKDVLIFLWQLGYEGLEFLHADGLFAFLLSFFILFAESLLYAGSARALSARFFIMEAIQVSK